MKKSTLLTVASVGAVALTSAMTFAAWDNLTATTTNTVTFDRINVTATTKEAMTVTPRTLDTLSDDTVSATSDIVVDLSSVKDSALTTGTQLKFVPTVMKGETKVDSNEYQLVIKEGNLELTGDSVNGYKDTTITLDNKNSYTVEVTPIVKTDGTSTITNEELTVKVAATFEKAGS